jgi:hypothetical protein
VDVVAALQMWTGSRGLQQHGGDDRRGRREGRGCNAPSPGSYDGVALAEMAELGVVVVWLDAEVAGKAGAEAWSGGGVLVVPRHGEAGLVEGVRATTLGRRGGRWSHSGTTD